MADTAQAGFSETPPHDAAGAKINGEQLDGDDKVKTTEWDGKLILRKQVVAHGDVVGEIRFREPTAGDIERIGNPVTMGIYDRNPKVHFESNIMTMMMAHLANVPPSTIRQMHPKDWNNGAWLLANFFMPDLWG